MKNGSYTVCHGKYTQQPCITLIVTPGNVCYIEKCYKVYISYYCNISRDDEIRPRRHQLRAQSRASIIVLLVLAVNQL
jgi:hypothetical protein